MENFPLTNFTPVTNETNPWTFYCCHSQLPDPATPSPISHVTIPSAKKRVRHLVLPARNYAAFCRTFLQPHRLDHRFTDLPVPRLSISPFLSFSISFSHALLFIHTSPTIDPSSRITTQSPIPNSLGAFRTPLPPPPTIKFPGRYLLRTQVSVFDFLSICKKFVLRLIQRERKWK